MKKIIYSIAITSAVFLASCGEERVPSPIQEHVASFNESRSQANIEFGLNVVDAKKGLTNLNCVAFDRAVGIYPTTLGGLSSKMEAMWARGLAGCGSAAENMQYYESARRALKEGWDNTLIGMSDTERILLQNHGIGNLVNDQLKQVFVEEHACIFNRAEEARNRGSTSNLSELRGRCKTGGSEVTQCQYSTYTSHTHQYSYGNKDYPAYLSELFSKYKQMYLHCTPTSYQEYVNFHATVPMEIFDKGGARFKFAVDPVLNCYLAKARERLSRRSSFSANTLYKSCGKDFNMSGLYTQEDIPRISTTALIDGKESGSRGSWLFDPTKSNEEPQRWTFNECENQMILWMGNNGFNLVKPESIKNYCKNIERRKQREERKTFRRQG